MHIDVLFSVNMFNIQHLYFLLKYLYIDIILVTKSYVFLPKLNIMKSRNNHFIAILALITIQMGCTPAEKPATVELEKNALIGSWRLIKTIEIGHEDSTNRRDGEEKFYIKHVNNTHFVWVEYDRINNLLLGTGGGTYTLDGNTYTEYIQFYYPAGANELGQAIPFWAELSKDGIWHHKGYAKLMEFDPETAENVMVDSAIIDELWERIDIEPADDSNGKLVGSWDFVNFLEQSDSTYSEYPPFYGIMKILTPTHFTWVQYNTEGDEIFGIGGGSYSIAGDKYVEHIEFVHPDRLDQIGVNAVYTWRQNNPDHWNISGVIESRDSLQYLEENWAKYNTDSESETETESMNLR